jgi:hypothetical protein
MFYHILFDLMACSTFSLLVVNELLKRLTKKWSQAVGPEKKKPTTLGESPLLFFLELFTEISSKANERGFLVSISLRPSIELQERRNNPPNVSRVGKRGDGKK